MEFELDEMQAMLRDSAARWAEKHYAFDARRKLAVDAGLAEANWATFAEMGWLGAGLSEEQGGYGGGAAETAILMEEFGKVLLLEPFLPVAVLAAQALIGVGDERASALVGEIVSGESRIVLAHEEPKALGRLDHVEMLADADGAITGLKTLVLGAPFASKLIVSARSGGVIGLYLVDADAPGVERRDYRLADGSRASEIRFSGARAEQITADGRSAIERAYAYGITMLCAEAVGAMDRALWLTRDYLKTRKQFGKYLGEFQVLQHRMADMLIELELARSALFRALAALEGPADERDHAVSACKVQIGKAGRVVGGQAIQLHGGIGVTEEFAIGHYFKRLSFIDNAFGSTARHVRLMAGRIQAET